MPVPKPKEAIGKQRRESTRTFLKRCIRTLTHTDPDRPHKQRIAMCYTSARRAGRKPRRKEAKD